MRTLIKNISTFFVSVIVLFLSIGISFSKMSCSLDNSFYFGTKVPSCSEVFDVSCIEEQEKISCCINEIEKTCCLDTDDESCNSETQTIHFDFETLIVNSEYEFKAPELFSFVCINKLFSFIFTETTYFSGIPPPKLNQPKLAELQSFLL